MTNKKNKARLEAERCYEARFGGWELDEIQPAGHTTEEWIAKDYLEDSTSIHFNIRSPEYREESQEYVQLIKERHPNLRRPTEEEMEECRQTQELAMNLCSSGDETRGDRAWDHIWEISDRLIG